MPQLLKFLREEDATSSVEYAVMLALILVGVMGAIGSVGAESGGLWGGIESDLQDAGMIE